MDLFDALSSLHKAFPELPQDELRSALDKEVEAKEKSLTGRNKYSRAVESAHYRINEWLKTGDEYMVKLDDLDDLCRFVSSHRPACVWAVIRAKQAKMRAERGSAA